MNERCPDPARLTLFDVIDGNKMAELGNFCRWHFHQLRDRMRELGRRTGVSIITEEPAPRCDAATDGLNRPDRSPASASS